MKKLFRKIIPKLGFPQNEIRSASSVFQKNPINYYLVDDPRRAVIELYNGNKGRELLENCDAVAKTLTFDRENWHLLTTFLFS